MGGWRHGKERSLRDGREGDSGNPAAVIVVSGLPRSGTSMMMQILEAGGVQTLTDRIRTADEDNRKGYYEFERVKRLPADTDWLPEARGKAVKVISELLRHLPEGYPYKVIFMIRDLREVLASQQQMLVRRGVENPDRVGDDRMAAVFERHLREVEAGLAKRANVEALYADYNDVLRAPEAWSERIRAFLGLALDVEEMAGVVDGMLYRQRRG